MYIVSEIVKFTSRFEVRIAIWGSHRNLGLASLFAISIYLGCNSKLNLTSKFHVKVATHLPHLKLRTEYTLSIIF